MSFLEKLKDRWKVKSAFQVVIILIVFACTGFTIIGIKHLIGINGDTPIVWRILFYICILPIYNIVLLCYGWLFGQFKFFLEFEKRFFNRMVNVFKRK